MTALTPDDLARIEARADLEAEGWHSSRPDDSVCVQSRADVLGLVAGVRSLQARITELEGERDGPVKEMHARELHHFEAEDLVTELRARAEKAEKILLGGIGQSWRKVVDDAILTLRGATHG